jgi:hypothetical protein
MSSKQSANCTPQEDEQLTKSWLKISMDGVQSTGQKRKEFFKQVADKFKNFALSSIDREATSVMHQLVFLLPSFKLFIN